jgi:hypothetical protein
MKDKKTIVVLAIFFIVLTTSFALAIYNSEDNKLRRSGFEVREDRKSVV